jgi:hypothetical protein
MHSLHKHPMEVSFLEEQQLIFHVALDGPPSKQPVYCFNHEPAYKQFQSDVRNKHLLGEYDIDIISSKHEKGDRANHDKRFKFWLSKGADPQAWLSFPAKLDAVLKYYELPLKWFQKDLEAEKWVETVKINFKVEPREERTRSPSSSTCKMALPQLFLLKQEI